MNELVEIRNNQVVVSSRQVAEKFEKEHKNVLRDIKEILAAQNSATKFFQESTFENRGKQYPEYLMNRDGFTLLAMGFTGNKALEWKIKYINAFNEMENLLMQPRLNSVVEKGEFLLKCADNAKTDNWKQLLVRGAANMVAGYELLPPLEVPKTYSAGEVGAMLGISANMVGRIAKRNGLKTEAYGVWCHDIARNGQKEVEIFRYNENGIEAIGEAIHNL